MDLTDIVAKGQMLNYFSGTEEHDKFRQIDKKRFYNVRHKMINKVDDLFEKVFDELF